MSNSSDQNNLSSDLQWVQDQVLNVLIEKQVPVSIFLKNGVRLKGIISAFDKYGLSLKSSDTDSSMVLQMIYKSAISTIVPDILQNREDLASKPR